MREIKFRGKRINNEEWIYGSFAHCHDEKGNPTIIPLGDNRFFSVAVESVGQYTGSKDKNGKEIYEGDIVKSVDEDLKPQIYTIVWSEARSCFDMKLGYSARINFPLSHVMEVIGNTYENPDLLK